MPKLPFSLFDFKNIDRFEIVAKKVSSVAGVAIPETMIYKVPDYKFTLLLQASVLSTKITSTAFAMYIIRATVGNVTLIQDWLINEDLGTTEASMSWPSSLATTTHGLGWTLVFLFPGDEIRIAHALTAAETIEDKVGLTLIEYSDPRYEK